MLPFIVGGGVLIGALASVFKEKCSSCDSYWTLNEPCLVCRCEICGDCGKNLGPLGRCCTKHGDINTALANESKVTVYSKNYKGKIGAPHPSINIETAFYREKENAERALRFIAALNGVGVVQNVEFIRDTGADGNYKFSIWKATGII